MPHYRHLHSPEQQVINARSLYGPLGTARVHAPMARAGTATPDKALPVLDVMVFTFGAASLALAILATLLVQPQSIAATGTDQSQAPAHASAGPTVL